MTVTAAPGTRPQGANRQQGATRPKGTIRQPGATRPQGAPDWLLGLVETQNRYIEQVGWPVTIEVEARRLVLLAGNQIDAITMPAVLGARVLIELRTAVLAGPVLAGPDQRRWTFLTQPTKTPCPPIPADLRPRSVHPTAPGEHIVLPSAEPAESAELDSWSWVVSPGSHPVLPPWPAVIATARRVVAREPGDLLTVT
jgi:hypothetical protein